MSDPKPETAPEAEATPAAPGPAARKGVAPPNPSQKDSDRVARPGFRNPPNNKSKAMKSQKKKKK